MEAVWLSAASAARLSAPLCKGAPVMRSCGQAARGRPAAASSPDNGPRCRFQVITHLQKPRGITRYPRGQHTGQALAAYAARGLRASRATEALRRCSGCFERGCRLLGGHSHGGLDVAEAPARRGGKDGRSRCLLVWKFADYEPV